MENTVNKGISAEAISRPRSLRTAAVARLLAGTMAAMAACSSDELVGGTPSLVGIAGDDVNSPNDSTSALDAASDTTTTNDGGMDMAGDTTPVAADSSSDALASDTSGATETINLADTSTDATAADTSGPAKDATSTADISHDSTDVVPSSPKQICEAVKANMISALKPGAAECTETIPGVGKVAGKLVCDGANLMPNCVVN